MSPKELSAKLEAASGALAGVERKRMPGGYALFVAGKIFANITVDGRIGVKLTVPWCFEELAGMPGADPWMLGQKRMDHWVLIPAHLNTSDVAIRDWVERAYQCATNKMPTTRTLSESPPTTRSRDVNGMNGANSNGASAALYARARARSVPPVAMAATAEVPQLPKLPTIPPITPRRRSMTPPPPSTRTFDPSSYAAPPPSSVGIRLVPKDSKSPYEDTIVGVPAPPSSRIDFEDD